MQSKFKKGKTKNEGDETFWWELKQYLRQPAIE